MGFGRKPPPFVRMPDGTNMSLTMGSRNASRSTSPRGSRSLGLGSPHGGTSSASPGRVMGSGGGKMLSPIAGDRSSTSPTSPASAAVPLTPARSRLGRLWPGRRSNTASSGTSSPPDSPVHSRNRRALSLLSWSNEDEAGASQTDFLDLRMTPQQLYNRVPQPKVLLTCRQAIRNFRQAARASIWTSIGHWKESWNVGPHHLRLRTRDLMREAGRGHLDVHDYGAVERATAANVAGALLLMPGGIALAALARHCNWPPLRHCDHSMDILRHKIEEYVERGVSYKEAEITLKRMVQSKKKHRKQREREQRLERVLRVLSLVTVACLVLMAGLLSGGNAALLAPPLFAAASAAVVLHAFIERLVLPLVRLQHGIQINVHQEVPEEKKLTEQVLEALGSSSSSDTEGSSSDYSSANESFLDEAPRNHSEPHVIGVKSSKILVRPKNARLRLRFELLRSLPGCRQHLRRWQGEDPLRFGRLLQVPEGHPEAMRQARSVSFRPTEESDRSLKAQRFTLRRSHSLGTMTVEEQCERRAVEDHWAGFADIFEEKQRPGMPVLPATAVSMPYRGAVEEFEAMGVFRQHTHELTNKDLICMNPLTDTVLATRVGACLRRGQQPPKPWEVEIDEALAKPFGETDARNRPRLAPMEEEEERGSSEALRPKEGSGSPGARRRSVPEEGAATDRTGSAASASER